VTSKGPVPTLPFLTARWSDLLLVSYEVEESLIRRIIHPSLEPDRWNGRVYATLVAYNFLDTRVRGVRVPGFVNFPEINLRTCVRHGDRRGVSYVRELVPGGLVAGVARLLYNEPYPATRMGSSLTREQGDYLVTHRWSSRGRVHFLQVRGSPESLIPAADSLEHHLKEPNWGFGFSPSGRLLSYRVNHPVWAVRPVRESRCQVDFGNLYGAAWSGLGARAPASVIYAVGSEVAVFPPENQPRPSLA
jgi:uncharacterized protein YqjF (DUF2071 family)